MPDLADLQVILEDAQRRVREEGGAALKAYFKGLFDQHPELVDIRWRQYTPYFNDGEPCLFRVSDPYFKINGFDASQITYCDYEDDRYLGYEHREQFPWVEAVAKTICSDTFEQIALSFLGDHVMITVTADDIRIDDYDHD